MPSPTIPIPSPPTCPPQARLFETSYQTTRYLRRYVSQYLKPIQGALLTGKAVQDDAPEDYDFVKSMPAIMEKFVASQLLKSTQ